MALPSLGREFFDDFYDGRTDPWGYETRWYEERKRAVLLAALPRPHYESAFELGCSTGVVTEQLADRCERLLAVDVAAAPLALAQRRLRDRSHVELRQLQAPAQWPTGRFDLIVLSEVGYYWDEPDLRSVLGLCRESLVPAGTIVACHWRHAVREYPLSGDEVHAILGTVPDLQATVTHLEEDFLLTVLEPAPADSVARATGLV